MLDFRPAPAQSEYPAATGVKRGLLRVTGCLPEWVGATAAVPPISDPGGVSGLWRPHQVVSTHGAEPTASDDSNLQRRF
jgi:hypothetical protein